MIVIPFPKWSVERIRAKQKSVFIDREPWGVVGDRFYVHDGIYEIDRMERRTLAFVRDQLWSQMGAVSPEDMIQNWERVAGIRFDAKSLVVVHHFAEVSE
jgi:hypothetical protein